jgi:hypothetical protein
MATALIPRLIWPDKPTINDANRYYQILYGLSTAETVDSVNIGAGCLAEAYINFGWPGVVCVMFGIGILLGIYARGFVSQNSSVFFLAVGLGLVQKVLGIESQMSAYLGGVVQAILLTTLVFLPVLQRPAVGVAQVGYKAVPILGRRRVEVPQWRGIRDAPET